MIALSRWVLIPVLVIAAVLLQVTVFTWMAVYGVVPNLALLVVVAVALVRGPEAGAAVGFAAGLLLDVAPPANHIAGRWALALVVVGFLAGRVRADAARSVPAAIVTVAASSFIGTSLYAFSGALLRDGSFAAGSMLQVIAIAVVWDLVLAALLLAPTMSALRRTSPPQVAY